MRLIRATLCFVWLSCAALPSTVGAQEDMNAALRASLARIEEMRKERPRDGVLVLFHALTYVRLGEREKAFELLRTLKGRKLGIIPSRDVGLETIWDDSELQEIRNELAEEEPRTPDAPVAFRLPDPKLIPEGIAYDPDGKRFFIGSIAQRKIVTTDGKGMTRDFSSPEDKLATVLGLTVDAGRGHLYAVSTNGFLEEAKKERHNSVARYDLKSGRLLDRFTAPEAQQLNDLALAPDGTLYVTDSLEGSLFRKRPDEATLSRLGDQGVLRGANGIASSPEGRIYVATSTGIAQVDPEKGSPTRLPQPDDAVTGGIDGLAWHDGALVGVQNVPNPGRVIRIELGDDGNRITGMAVLQSSHHPDFVIPTTGVMAEGAFFVLGNTYVRNYQPDGSLKNESELKAAAIVKVPLHR